MLLKQNSCHLDGSSCLLFFIYFPGLLDKGRFKTSGGTFDFVHIVFPQLPDKLVFAGTPQRKTFPLGGRWHGEAVTDEGKRGDFLSGNGKRGKVRRCSSDSVRRKPSVRQPLIRPSVRYLSTFPLGGRSFSVSLQIPIYYFAEQSR